MIETLTDTSRSRRWTLAAGTLAVVFGACNQATPPFNLGTVTPDRAYTDGTVILRVTAGLVRPALRADVAAGSLVADLTSVQATLVPDVPDGRPTVRLETLEWSSADFSFWVKAKDGLGAGSYTMELVDPHGHTTRLADAFMGLGPDPLAPTLVAQPFQQQPFLAAGAVATGEIVADDGLGGIDRITWETLDGAPRECPSFPGSLDDNPRPPPHQLSCRVTFPTPSLDEPGAAPLHPFTLHVRAWDVAGREATLDVPLFVARRPIIDDFNGKIGALGGYQPFSVTGSFFLKGTRVLVDEQPIVGVSSGGDRQNDQSIVGWTPPHPRAGAVSVRVVSPAGDALATGQFTYSGPPRPREIQPPVGPASGGIRVTVRGNDLHTGVIVYLGATRNARKPLSRATNNGENKVTGCLPAGTGTVTVWTYDPITGDGQLPDGFTYQDPSASADAGATMTDPACL